MELYAEDWYKILHCTNEEYEKAIDLLLKFNNRLKLPVCIKWRFEDVGFSRAASIAFVVKMKQRRYLLRSIFVNFAMCEAQQKFIVLLNFDFQYDKEGAKYINSLGE